jgi:hypothetical protein
VKEVTAGEKEKFTLYSYSEAKFLEILVKKHRQIIRHLTDNYLKGMTQSKAKVVTSTTGDIIK